METFNPLVIKVYATFAVKYDLHSVKDRVRNIYVTGDGTLLAKSKGRIFVFNSDKVSVCYLPENDHMEPIDSLLRLRQIVNKATGSSATGKIQVVVLKTSLDLSSLGESPVKINILHDRIEKRPPGDLETNVLEPSLCDKLVLRFQDNESDRLGIVFHIVESGDCLVFYDLRQCVRPMSHLKCLRRVANARDKVQGYMN